MKKLRIFLLLCVMAILFAIPSAVLAEEEEALPEPGITPDSPFYFMDQWGKSFSLLFTFNPESKVAKAMRYADERMAEIDAMLAQNKIKYANKAQEEYQNCWEVASKYMEQVRLKGGDVSEGVALMAEKHLTIANGISDNASEEAQGILTRTRENAMLCQETALKNMAQGDPEKAAQLNLQLMTRQLNRIRTQVEDANGEAVQRRLEEYNRLGNLGEEISQIARGSGRETAVDQLVGVANVNHLEILAQVQQRVQGEAQEAVQAIIQKCIQNQVQIVNRLQAQNQLGPVPEEVPMQNTFQNRTQESTETQTQTGTQTQNNQGTETSPTTQTQSGQGTQNTTEPGGDGGSSGGGTQQGRQ